MNTYLVQQPLRNNGKRYGIGEVVELSSDDAERLISLGVIRSCEGGKDGGAGESLPPVDNTVQSIAQLFNQWHAKGNRGNGIEKKPNVDSVRKALSQDDITVEQRDAAWNIYRSDVGAEGGE